MEILNFRLTLMATFLCFSYVSAAIAAQNQQSKKTYIVHMDHSSMPDEFDHHLQWYDSSLNSVTEAADMVYTYNNVIQGFSARLDPVSAKLLEQQPGILSVQPERIYQLRTTRSPEFLGLGNIKTLPTEAAASEVIVGVLDSGIWPGIRSLDDTGLGPIPSTWKGECEVGKNFSSSSCNRKLIGARFFLKGYEAAEGPVDETKETKSPVDDDGHGTHTATTAAGSAVPGASFLGYAIGTAQGMARRARVASYKVCWISGCFETDILAAMDQAIADGVNILSLSIGEVPPDYSKDLIAIGAFRATEQGIFVSCSAGNSGPTQGSLENVAPWVTTVGAGTIDRDFPVFVTLGNGKSYLGTSLYSGKSLSNSLLVPLIYAGNASNTTNGNLCVTESLIPAQVAGKIVICDLGGSRRQQKGLVVNEAGGVGMILANTEMYGNQLVADAHILPQATVGHKDGDAIKIYAFSDPKPLATITVGAIRTRLGVQPSPVTAAFSSRGPNPLTPGILKPDLIAPGVNILAAWSGNAGPSGLIEDKRRVAFNIQSGTSMSCPHVSGLAAIVKAAHPEWSPAAIKSALMTTADTAYRDGKTILDIATGQPSTPFDYGSGHANPMAALDPGLVYDATADDYIAFLCALNYSASQIKQVTNRDFTCDLNKTYSVGNLNYPSFSILLKTANGSSVGVTRVVKYTRTLTNVGRPATYKVSVSPSIPSVKVLVEPNSIIFTKQNEKQSYEVTFTATSMPSGTNSFARLEWSDGKHVVSSPIAFSWT